MVIWNALEKYLSLIVFDVQYDNFMAVQFCQSLFQYLYRNKHVKMYLPFSISFILNANNYFQKYFNICGYLSLLWDLGINLIIIYYNILISIQRQWISTTLCIRLTEGDLMWMLPASLGRQRYGSVSQALLIQRSDAPVCPQRENGALRHAFCLVLTLLHHLRPWQRPAAVLPPYLPPRLGR